MPASEPSRSWQAQKHQEILQQDNPTAFGQLSELALPFLIDQLRQEFRGVDHHLHESAAIDSLLAYHAAPEKYNPSKLSLFAYLRMAARHDLLNALDRDKRKERPLLPLDDPTIQNQLAEESENAALPDGNYTAYPETILRPFEATLAGSDRQFFLLMLNGVRATEPYAEILGVSHLADPEKRRAVKRTKDRLSKKLARFVQRHKV